MDLLTRQGYSLSCCGGSKRCGKCKVRFVSTPTLPTPADRMFLSPEELRKGFRLACASKPQGDFQIEVHYENNATMDVVTFDGIETEKALQEQKQKEVNMTEMSQKVMVAGDIGTTTIAMQLIDKTNGKILATFQEINPQRVYGSDVISRIEKATLGKQTELEDCLLEVVRRGLVTLNNDAKQKLQIEDEIMAIVAGNTTMSHFMARLSVDVLGVYPFQPHTLRYPSQDGFYLMPGISTFVGGDIMAGIIATNLDESESYQLLIDLGTNGEMVLGKRGNMIATATAAGPAFEGGKTAGIHGSDMIAIVARLLEEEVIDSYGTLKEEWQEVGYPLGDLIITQEDIRGLQMAKAAIAAGIQILLEEESITIDDVEKVYLAGGFGYYLSVKDAIRIGLLPMQWRSLSIPAGNTSLKGAIEGGREGEEKLAKRCNHISECTKVYNLAENPNFNDYYIANLNLTTFPTKKEKSYPI